jgi:protein phosphatase 1 regulatory subunit 10
MPENIEARPRGEGSQERSTQEQRELTALGASYLVQPIPESPADLSPGSILPQEQVDENVVHMLAGAEIDALSWPPAMMTAPLAGASVSELVGQLAEGADLAVPEALPTPAFDPAVLAQLASSIPQEQLQQLAQMFATQQQPSPRGDQQSWDLQAPAFSADAANASGTPRDRWPATSEESRWGGSGRGRGRGRPVDGIRQFKSRIPCSFYAQGRQAHIPTPSSFRFCLNERTNGNPVKTDASTAISATSATIRVLARTARGV